MSLISGLTPSEISDFLGANYRGEASDVRPPWLLRAQDVEFEEGYIRSRRGFYEGVIPLTAGQPVSGFCHYMLGPASYIFTTRHNAGTGACTLEHSLYNAVPGGSSTLRAADGLGAVFAGIGNRMYYAAYDPDYEEGTFGVVLNFDGSPSFGYVWAPPLDLTYVAAWTRTPSLAATTTGLAATPGQHNLAFGFITKTGALTRPNIYANLTVGTSFAPMSASPSVGQKITVTLTPDAGHTWPNHYDKIFLLATTTRNLERYFIVPGTEQTVPNGTTTTITMDLDIQDAALNLATPFDDYMYTMYTGQFSASAQPIKPYYIFNCGERLGYFFKDASFGYAMAFSRPGEYEYLTFDRHVRFLPQRAKPIAAKWTQGAIYIFTENGTFALTDTGDDPVTWPPERSVSDKIGVSQPYALSLDRSGNGFVAHSLGLFPFNGGSYSAVPLSYLVNEDASNTFTGWNKTVWSMSSGAMVTVADDAVNHRVLVNVPATSGFELHSWNYLKGTGPTQVRYSNIRIGGSVPSFIAIAQNNGDAHSATRRQQLWMAPGIGNWILNCPSDELGGTSIKFRDTINATNYPINPFVWFPFLPERPHGASEHEHHFIQLRIKGVGSVYIEVKSVDEAMTTGALLQALSTGPARDLFFGFSMVSMSASARLSLSNVAGDWFELSHFAHYWAPYALKR